MNADLFLIGDSHSVALARGATQVNIRTKGGPLGTGQQLSEKFWVVDDGDFVLTAPHMAPLRSKFRDLLRCETPVLSTVGFNSLRFCKEFAEYAQAYGVNDPLAVLSQAAFKQTVLDARITALAFYRLMVSHEREIYVIRSPQRAPGHLLHVMQAFEDILISEVKRIGVDCVDIRKETTDETGMLLKKFALPDDQAHASGAYGQVAVLQCLEQIEAKQRHVGC